MPTLPITKIKIGINHRPIDAAKVDELSESILTNGLLNPVTIDADYNLIAGRHRLKACEKLGWQEIDCHIVEFESDEKARLAEIDENLIRNELNLLQRSELWWEREQILQSLGLRAKVGDNQHTCRGGATISPPPKTTRELAKQIGYSERTFQLGKQIAKDIHPDIKKLIQNTSLVKGVRSLKKLAQVGVQERIAAEKEEQAAIQAQNIGDKKAVQIHLQQAQIFREAQKDLQMQALKCLMSESSAKPKPKKAISLPISKSDGYQQQQNLLSISRDCDIRVKQGDEWMVGRHLVYCGDTTNQSFINLLPKNAALAIATPSSQWNHDYLVNEAKIVAVIRREGYIHEFLRHQNMPFQYEYLIERWYVGIFSHCSLTKPQVPMPIHNLEAIIAHLIDIYTNSKNFVIAPFIGNGEVLIACERAGRTCFSGDMNPQLVRHSILNWQQCTHQQAQKTVAS